MKQNKFYINIYINLDTPKKSNSSVNFNNWANKYLEVYKKPFVKPVSYESYKANINNHILPYFGKANLQDIKPVHVQDFFNKYSHFRKNTLSSIRSILNEMFDLAVKQEIVYKNPVKDVTINTTLEPIRKSFYNYSQTLEVIDFAKTHKYGLPVFIILKTGIRVGELTALKWSDIDFDNSLVKILRTVSYKSETKDYNTKTKSSVRDIPVDDEFINHLQKLKHDKEYIFNSKDSHCNISTIQKHIKKFMLDLEKEKNINKLSAHELRHTYGTILREKGIDLYTISKVMGHTDIKMTASVYVHNDINVLKNNMKFYDKNTTKLVDFG